MKIFNRDNLKKLFIFKYNKFNPSTNEWRNSIYNFNKYFLNTYVYEKSFHQLITAYFNLDFSRFNVKRKKNSNYWQKKILNLKRIIVSKTEIKHSLNNIIVNIYIYNKEKLFYLKKIKYLRNLRKNSITKNNNISFLSNSITPEKNFHNIYLYYIRQDIYTKNLSYLKYLSIKKIKRIKKIQRKINKKYLNMILFKRYIAKLYFNNIKFKNISLSKLTQISHKLWNKKITFHIINMKYIHLDNNLLLDTIIRKLKDRNKRVLKVIRKAIVLSKIPRIHPLLLIRKEKSFFKNFPYQLDKKILFFSPLESIINPLENITQIRKNILIYLKNIHLIGMWIEGKGRLTRRLTASRSVHKTSYKGTGKNIISSYQGYSSLFSKGYQKSTIDFAQKNSYNRNGSFGIKSYQNTY